MELRREGMVYLEFLRYCLNEALPLPESASMIDWRKMLEWAEQQAIVGVIYGGITDGRCKRDDGSGTLRIPFDVLMEWIGYANQIENRNKLMNERCMEIVSAFQKDGYKTCILKGQGNAMMYPNPLLRIPGDIDVWIIRNHGDTESRRYGITELRNGGRKDLLREIIRYVRAKNPEGKACYHHIDYGMYKGVEVEVHYRLSYANDFFVNRRLQRWFMVHGERFMVDLPEGTGSIPVLNWEFNLVFQLSHIYRHVIYSGLGLRQMIDYYYLLQMRNEKGEMRNEKVAVKREQSHTCMSSAERKQADQRSNEELGMTLRKLGLTEIAGAVMWVLGYLVHGERFLDEPSGRAERMVNGCRREEWMICEPDERRGRFLLGEIMEGGNFGIGMKSDIGWLSADSAIGRNILRLKRDVRLLRYFPSECLWEPVFRIWHFFWRVGHR